MRRSMLGMLVALALSAATGQSAAQLPGGKIAFLSNGGNFSSFDLCIMDPDGGKVVKLAPVNKVAASGWLLYPIAWSPDGTRLAYQLERDIYTVDVEGKIPVNLTKANLSTTNKHPAWSPDGTRIAFASLRGKPTSDIYVMNADGTNPVNLMEKQPEAANSNDETPAWSPDGTKIAFRSERDGIYNIYVMNADGTGPVQLTHETTSDCGTVAWSPDGRQIAFDVALKKTPWFVDIDVLDLDGSNRMRVSEVAGVEKFDNESPSWSPDGSKIVFMSNRRSHHYDIWMVNPDGSDLVRVSQGPASGDHQLFPAWSPLPRLVITPSAVRALSWGEVKAGGW